MRVEGPEVEFAGSNGASAFNSGFKCSQSRTRLTVVFHSGSERCLRPLPCKRMLEVGPRTTSATRALMISETRAPVLNSSININRSR